MQLKFFIPLAGALVLITGATSHFHTKEGCNGFAPPNDIKIPVVGFNVANGGISETDFNDVLDRIDLLYRDEVASHGADLQINRLWNDSTVNASAEQRNGKWILNMYGGLARHPEITKDGFAVVACHEMGHHLGGAPKYKGLLFPWTTTWASNEGEADYYSTLKCMRRYFQLDGSSFVFNNRLLKDDVDPTVSQRCQLTFANTDDQNHCIRNAYAGLSTARLLGALNNTKTPPQFHTPDTSVVKKTVDGHPLAQCRLDTYFSASLCTVAVDEKLNDKDYRPGSCHDAAKHTYGFRPKCWFSTKKPIFGVNSILPTVFY